MIIAWVATAVVCLIYVADTVERMTRSSRRDRLAVWYAARIDQKVKPYGFHVKFCRVYEDPTDNIDRINWAVVCDKCQQIVDSYRGMIRYALPYIGKDYSPYACGTLERSHYTWHLGSFMSEPVKCPDGECGWRKTYTRLHMVIQHLNDVHEWTFDQIADWLDTLDMDMRIDENFR